MDTHTPAELQAVLRPLASLLGKSEKARQKVAAGTWQHTMLGENIDALTLATALLTGSAPIDSAALDRALRAFASMIDRTAKSQGKFAPGTAPHTLQRNRLHALRLGEAAVQAAARTR